MAGSFWRPKFYIKTAADKFLEQIPAGRHVITGLLLRLASMTDGFVRTLGARLRKFLISGRYKMLPSPCRLKSRFFLQKAVFFG